MTPTPEQAAIIEAATSNPTSLMVKAYAGCAKTTTLTMLAKAMSVRPGLAIAFNRSTKEELEKRFPSHWAVKTMNGLGMAAWNQALGKRCALDADKVYKLTKDQVKKDLPDADGDTMSLMLSLVRRARMSGLVPSGTPGKGLIPDTLDGWQDIADSLYTDVSSEQAYTAREILKQSVKQSYAGVIDFDDQIYMSTLFGGVFPKFPRVVVDEAQDLSPLNHIMVQRSAADWLGVVGDPKQAIYAFRGADSASMGNMEKLRSVWTHLPLHTTFRCPQLIVARQQHHAPGFNCGVGAPEGEVSDWTEKPNWQLPDGQLAILCRNNAPLLSMAFKLIKKGQGCTILGNELGKGLIAFAKKLFPDPSTPADVCERVIEDWMEGEVSKALANDKQERVAVIRDKGECLLAVIKGGAKKAGDIAGMLNVMFSAANLRITLATGHKAKGLEWDNVLHLDPWRVPSKYAIRANLEGNPSPLEQDMNLRYVIETRTKKRFFLANLEQFQ